MVQFLTYDSENNIVPYHLSASIGYSEKHIVKWIKAVGADYGYTIGNLSYILCDDKKILSVNRKFLQHDYYTDVITFDYTTAQSLNGDIFISTDTVRSNAEMMGADYSHEMLRILIHGVLHLMGQNDKTPEDKTEMTRKENLAIAKFPI